MLDICDTKLMGKVVQKLRKKAGLSQEEIAMRTNLSRTAIQNLEKGKETLQLSTLMPVLNLLNVKMYINHPLLDKGIENFCKL